jgi:heme-degrading monooxygenase HmoA
MSRIASFHLVRDDSAVAAMSHLAIDRQRLRQTPGLRFSRLLGTGKGSDTGPSADVRRTALFAVWEHERDLERFLGESSITRRWAQAAEQWHVRLRAIGGHGLWRSVDVLDGLTPGTDAGPIAVLTRADVRQSAWLAFRAAGPAVSAELQDAPGLLAVAGVGELPVGRLGTFSLWADLASMRAFAASPVHVDVVRRTREDGWYGEELFARFEPYGSSGTWEGRDPLAT